MERLARRPILVRYSVDDRVNRVARGSHVMRHKRCTFGFAVVVRRRKRRRHTDDSGSSRLRSLFESVRQPGFKRRDF